MEKLQKEMKKMQGMLKENENSGMFSAYTGVFTHETPTVVGAEDEAESEEECLPHGTAVFSSSVSHEFPVG